jgi:hypothetical protein
MVMMDGIVILEGVVRVEGTVTVEGSAGGYRYSQINRVGIAMTLKKKSHWETPM